MSKIERQKRYRTTGGAAEFVKVETLVPADGREQILRLAATLRASHRRRFSPATPATHGQAQASMIVQALVAFREGCSFQPRQYGEPADADNIVVPSVNVPFPHRIDAGDLADALRQNAVPNRFTGHLARFLGELPLPDILRFCDRHQISPPTLAGFVRTHRRDLGVHRPELETHLDELVPNP